jgi:hypothetical protein
MKKLTIALAVLTGMIVSCKPKEQDTGLNSGDADLSVFVSIGGAVTAGFLDDALSYEGQVNSLGYILSEQFSEVGGGTFGQPWLPGSSLGINLEGKTALKLGYKTDCEGVTSLSPVRLSDVADPSLLNIPYGSTFHNYGVPHLKSTEISLVGYGDNISNPGNYNPFFYRMAADPVTSSVLGDAMTRNPTFFSVFVGMDEVLQYAKKGAAVGSLTPVNGADGVGFDGSIDNLLSTLTSNGAKGVVGTIPDVTEMPYFTTIPYNGLDLDEESATTLNEIYNPIGINFNVGKNPFVIEDPSAGVFGVRLMEEGELILLNVPLDSVKCYKMGSVFPFRNEFILTNQEIGEIRNRTTQYNAVLVSEAQSRGLAVADVESFYSKITDGFVYNGITMSARFVSGGAYSLDGIHLNPRGNALLANEFIKAVNETYNAKIPFADATKYRGIIFP